ncbi:DUF302 domain-containing protein [Sedimenticola sp.]|uniref:DUF302 domain-containing protein n=1 Tax=Sedimenticola sp. TaxID=1940285 RepID=UPI00258E0ACE|nr:DUF302 domain-containing protein [Sedimenticola sp.]MCW8903826.1 DUF302 domain-containing protein [Sedimenticola sp.]
MSYHLSKTIQRPFDDAIATVTQALKNEGFGILTEIDVQETLKKKINVDFKRYRILGACNPSLAYEALKSEEKIGTMLPCNVVVQEQADGRVEVSAIDPVASMGTVGNPALTVIAEQVQGKLRKMLDNL